MAVATNDVPQKGHRPASTFDPSVDSAPQEAHLTTSVSAVASSPSRPASAVSRSSSSTLAPDSGIACSLPQLGHRRLDVPGAYTSREPHWRQGNWTGPEGTERSWATVDAQLTT